MLSLSLRKLFSTKIHWIHPISTFPADMFAHEDGGPEPDWIKTEREQFADFRDLNKDGKMDLDEIRHWIMPQDYDHAQAEARHLVYESDQDKVSSSGAAFSLTPPPLCLLHPKQHFLYLLHHTPPSLSLSLGSNVDQTGDPGQLEHVCGKPGYQLWRRPHQEPRRALSSPCNSNALALSERGVVKTASTLLHRCVFTPASSQMSLWSTASDGRRNKDLCCHSHRGTVSIVFVLFFFFFYPPTVSVSDIQERSRMRRTPASPSTVPFQPARTVSSRRRVCERRALPDTAQTPPQHLEASMWNSEEHYLGFIYLSDLCWTSSGLQC